MELKSVVEAALFAAQRPLSIAEMAGLFPEDEKPDVDAIRNALADLTEDYQTRPIELKEIASGFRFQVRGALSPWVSRLFEERPARYSKAFLETLAIIAYRQPVTRGEIEDIRGVSVSTLIIRSLLEREWVQVVGHKEVPGRPALYATTAQFLDYFNLKSLNDLPPLQALIEQLASTGESASPEPEMPSFDHDKTEAT